MSNCNNYNKSQIDKCKSLRILVYGYYKPTYKAKENRNKIRYLIISSILRKPLHYIYTRKEMNPS